MSRRPRTPREHGTTRGYRQHKTHSEDPCPPCSAAMNEYLSGYRATHPEVRAGQLRRSKARHRALARLAREYPGRFLQLLDEETRALEGAMA